VVTATGSGVYTLAPLETSPAATGLPVLLRVPRPTTGGDYYLSFRRPIGYDSNMRIDYDDRTSIHTRPSTNTLLVRLLSDGQTFADPTNGLVITQTSHDTTAVRIAVSTTCGNGVLDPGEECDGTNLGGATCGGCAGTAVRCAATACARQEMGRIASRARRTARAGRAESPKDASAAGSADRIRSGAIRRSAAPAPPSRAASAAVTVYATAPRRTRPADATARTRLV